MSTPPLNPFDFIQGFVNDGFPGTMSRIEVDPTELLPHDVVVSIRDHDESGCHCDVKVTVMRMTWNEP